MSMACAPAFPLLCAYKEPPPAFEVIESCLKASGVQRPAALVIDDEHIIADTVAQILQLSGFDALPAYSGRAALEQARTSCPDVVITDVVMPDLNGIETAKLLLEHCPSTKILLLSGQAATHEMIKKARAEGFEFELLAKPLHPDDLLAVLQRLGF